MASLLPNGKQQFLDANGAPLAGGSVYFYIPNTTTFKNTWQDAGATTLNTNPVVLDSAGEAVIYGIGTYRQIVTDSSGNTIWDQTTADNSLGLAEGSSLDVVTSTGSANAYAVSYDSDPTVYTEGQIFQFIANFASTGAATLNVNSLGAKNIYLPGTNSPSALVGGEIQNGQVVSVVYDGTEFVMTSPISYGTSAGQAISLDSNAKLPAVDGSQLTNLAVPKWQIAGFLPTSISGTNTTAAVTVSSGQAVNSTDAAYINSSSNISWAVSNGNAINGYAGGTTLPNSSTIHFFVCSGTSGTGTFASTSLTPTFPTGYATYTRRIFSLWTDSNGALLGGYFNAALEVAGGSVKFTQQEQGNYVGVSTTATRTLYALSVPSGIQVEVDFRATLAYSANAAILFQSPAEADVSPAVGGPASLTSVAGSSGNQASGHFSLLTNTSSQVAGRATTASATISIYPFGWTDFRRN